MKWFCTDREDKLSSSNRSVVNSFQEELAQQISSLCNMVATSMSQQNEHLHCIETLCQSFLDTHHKVVNFLLWAFLLWFLSFFSIVFSFRFFVLFLIFGCCTRISSTVHFGKVGVSLIMRLAYIPHLFYI